MRHHVKHLLTAHIHNELPPHLQERVTRHIRQCDDCYAALLRERELARLLEDRMPSFGTPRPERLARLLPVILAETARRPVRKPLHLLPGFGLALVVSLVLALMVPVLIAPRAVADHAPSQPAPYMIPATPTQSVTDSPVMVPVSPTAVACRLDAATESPYLHPLPAPIAQATPVREADF